MSSIKIKLILVSAALLFKLQLPAQPYHIGDTIPDITFRNIFNSAKEKMSFSDFKGKLIILDFWDPSCIACLEAFPKMEALQKKFRRQVQVLLVNRETLASTRSFFAKRKQIKIPDLPFITSDSILQNWFTHQGLPFHVWIDSNKVLQYMIDGYNTTAENVSSFLQGKHSVITAYKTDTYVQSLISDQWRDSVLFNSYLSRCVPGIHLEASYLGKGFKTITLNCNSVIELYLYAYNKGNPYGFKRPGRLSLEIKDLFPFVRPENNNIYDEWQRKFSYDYQVSVPLNSGLDLYELMKQDLTRYFGLDASIENRNVSCLVLIKIGAANILKTSGEPKIFKFYDSDLRTPNVDPVRYVKNVPFRRFSKALEEVIEGGFKKPFIDSTGIDENIDISIPGKIIDNHDYEELKRELRKYDLDLVEKYCKIPVLVIRGKCGK